MPVTLSHDDRRRGDRHAINPELAALDPGSLTYVSNLSEYGVFIQTRVRLPVGTPVELRFTVLLDDPVVISGPGRVVHHQDEPRGMGVAFGSLSAEMQLRVIDAINWYRARAMTGADRVFRTRELTPDELEQIEAEESEDGASESVTNLSVRDVVEAASGSYANLSARNLEEVPDGELDAAESGSAPAAARGQTRPYGQTREPAPPPAKPAAPPPPPPKSDEYEDF
jgi:Tfp pilus assembly protein PilZ